MKVRFIVPKGIHRGFSPGLAYVSTFLKNNNNIDDIKIIDINNRLDNTEKRFKECFDADLVGFTVLSMHSREIAQMIQQIKSHNPDVKIVVGGPHINVAGEEFLTNSKSDVGVLGEGEITLSKFVKNWNFNTKGLIYKDDGEVKNTGKSERIKDLDKLPFPEYELFDSFTGKISRYSIVSSRGCPFSCSFCSINFTMGRKWIGRSPESIIKEIQHAKEKYKPLSFNFNDDNLLIDRKRAVKIFESIIDEHLNIKFGVFSGVRADLCDEEIVALMKDAGCDGVAIGMESGSPEVFKGINKKETHEDIEEAVRLFKKYNILVEGNFIIGLPNSTLKEERESIKFAKNLKIDSAIFGLLLPFPGTEVINWVNKHGTWLADWRECFPQGINPKVLFETPEFSKDERLKAYYEANIKLHNYFAFMDEHKPISSNIFNIAKTIINHDISGIPSHIFWGIKHRKKVFDRLLYKNR